MRRQFDSLCILQRKIFLALTLFRYRNPGAKSQNIEQASGSIKEVLKSAHTLADIESMCYTIIRVHFRSCSQLKPAPLIEA